MQIDYIVVQAGGKGTRMKHLTQNKPKTLVPVFNLPMIFHLFNKYPEKKFIIIGDYKIDVLKKYLRCFSKVKYLVVNAGGYKGTCAGLQEAIQCIPENKAFMLIWSDLVLNNEFEFPNDEGNFVGISKGFPCRWRYCNSVFEEISSDKMGVAGLFVFKEKSVLNAVPWEGEFVRWLSNQKIDFSTIELPNIKEFGLVEEYEKLEQQKCRPFNRLIVFEDRLQKDGIDEQGKALAVREKRWYKAAIEHGIKAIPHIYSFEPFVMEKIKGKNIYEYNFSFEEKKRVLSEIVSALKELHKISKMEVDFFSLQDAYFEKTFSRLERVRTLIPYTNQEYIMVNGRKCPNVYFNYEKLEDLCKSCIPRHFSFIHGDCTFSNMMLRNDMEVVFIDPRGYFGFCELVGDPAYDWAKLYYSIVGNYDQFNLKRFHLNILDSGVELEIQSNGWEEMEDELLALVSDEILPQEIKILHAIIWLSLTTYAWEDYDSVCGAFYKGIYHLAEILEDSDQ